MALVIKILICYDDDDIARPSLIGSSWAQFLLTGSDETVWTPESSASWDIRQPTMALSSLTEGLPSGRSRHSVNNQSHILN